MNKYNSMSSITIPNLDPISVYTEIGVHVGAYWVLSLSFLCLDLYWRSNGIYKYKVLGLDRPFADNGKIIRAITVSFINQVISLPLIYMMTIYCYCNDRYVGYIELLVYYILYLVLADQWFYWTHRLMHTNKWLYRNVHQIHHEWTHPMSIRTIYAHPLEHLISNIGSVFIGPLLLPLPTFWVHLWGIFAVINSVCAHSGIVYISGSHDMHHRYLKCNYGVLGLSDKLYGTYRMWSFLI